jgi:hypothetical protein
MTYDGERANNCGLNVTDRMQIPIRTIVLGLLLAFSAMAVRAQPKAAEATLPINPAATQQSTPIDLTLHSATTQPSSPIDFAAPPATTQQSTPIDFTLYPATMQPSSPIDLAAPPATTQQSTPIGPAPHPATTPQWYSADVAMQSESEEIKRVARWVSDSGDNGGLPYLLVDKVNAQVFAFNPAGQLQAMAPALLGMSRGDRLLAPNTAKMAQMPPQVRITPAGRFVSQLAIDSHGKELLVLNYDASISMHPVIKGTPAEHRAERLASPTSADNRISFGCINVPPAFYMTFVHPAFNQTKGIVYVLPEMGPASQLFGFSETAPGAQPSSTALNARTGQTAVAAPGAK